MNFIHQLLVHAVDVNLLVKVYRLYRKKNPQSSAIVSREVSQAVSADRTKCVYMTCEQNVGQNYIVKIGNTSFENIVKFRYWGATIVNQNYILEQTKNKMNSGNA